MKKNPLLQSLFEETPRGPLSVSELNDQVKGELERRFASVWVEGEISNFHAAASGHWYFTLSDGEAQIRAACYARNNARIRFKPTDGLHVAVRGKLTIYKPRGEYQILVESLEPVGEGALKVAFDQIKAKLAAEGLFAQELKRALPLLPRRVGVVTSPNGAAFHDILNVLSRRTRTVHVTLIPTRVQGEGSGEEIASAIELANIFSESSAEKIDVLIVGRGGGSSEDLWAFNEERVARAIRASKIPVISAVGHEIDFTIADFVADLRAPTPSAAAEIVAESEDRIRRTVADHRERLRSLASYQLLGLRHSLQELIHARVFAELPERLRDLRFEIMSHENSLAKRASTHIANLIKRLELLSARMSPGQLSSRVSFNAKRLAIFEQRNTNAIITNLDLRRRHFKIASASLDAMSPLRVLDRGYSIVQNLRGEIINSIKKVGIEENLRVRMTDGKLEVTVKSFSTLEST
jgi:exodeoxyribonuclease VII large subunit